MFSEEQRFASNNVLVQNPVLNLYRLNVETQLHTDACMDGLGTVRLQKR